MKNIQAVLAGQAAEHVYDTADTVNLAGGKAWKMESGEQVRQLMFTGTFGNSFYATQRELVTGADTVIRDAAENDPEMLAKEIVAGRNEGYIRSAPIMGLAILSLYSPKLFREIFCEVVRTGNDMEDFIGFMRALDRGFGYAIKNAMKDWLKLHIEGQTFYALKYTKQASYALRIARPRSTDPVYDYIIEKTRGNAKSYELALETYPALNAMEVAKDLIKDDNWEKVEKLITEHNLDPASLLGLGNPPQKVWISLSRNMGVMMYLKYLAKLIRENSLDMDIMRQKLTVANLKKAKVFPFRLYIAYKNLPSHTFDGEDARAYLGKVLDQYIKEYDWGVWNQRVVVAPDISASMTSTHSNPVPAVIAGMFSGFLYKGIEKSMVIPWETKVHEYNVPKQDSVLSHIQKIEEAPGWGTYMEAPIDHMNDNKINADVVIFITDGMEWGAGWMKSWIKYKKSNKNAKAVLIRCAGYATNSFSQEHADKYDVYQVFGWTDNVVKWIEHQVLGK